MADQNIIKKSPSCIDDVGRCFAIAQERRRAGDFGKAMNEFQKVIDLVNEGLSAHPDCACVESLISFRERAKASIALIRDINAFVNADLMNP